MQSAFGVDHGDFSKAMTKQQKRRTKGAAEIGAGAGVGAVLGRVGAQKLPAKAQKAGVHMSRGSGRALIGTGAVTGAGYAAYNVKNRKRR